MFDYEFMVRAFVAASVVGLAAPLVGIYLVQRRLSLLGDGIGHIALTGIGVALLTNTAPLWGAMIAAVIGAVLVEWLRLKSKLAGDTALSLLFYGGIAGGVLLTSMAAGASSTSLTAYLFGSLTTVSSADLIAVLILGLCILLTVATLGRQLTNVSVDPEHGHVQGLSVRGLSLVLAILSAVTVTVGMRAVGLLLVSAIMVVPVVAAQRVAKSFLQTAILSSLLGWISAAAGLTISYYVDVPPGSTIVLFALAVFVLVATLGAIFTKLRKEPR
ncbi:MAG: hypothetical protein RL587_51 [Actinomycetota bacterium]|jgi:zinc transport system permease protein